MALTRLSGIGLKFPAVPLGELGGTLALASALMDAAAERVAMCGRVWWPDRGTHSVRKIHFLTGTVTGTDDATNQVRVSVQGIDQANGPPPRPDGTILGAANGGYAVLSFAGLVLNSTKDDTWITTGALVADVSLTQNQEIAIDFAFVDGAGAAKWADAALNIKGVSPANISQQFGRCITSLYSGAPAWAGHTVPNVVLEDDTGLIFGTLLGAMPCKAVDVATFNSGSNPDERALAFTPEVTMKVDGAYAYIRVQGNCSIVLYTGTTALCSVPIDSNTVPSAAGGTPYHVPFDAEYTLTAGVTYYLSVLPSSGSNVNIHRLDLNAAGHRVCYSGGTAIGYATRIDAGAWAAITTTSIPMMGFLVSSIDDGVSAGGGGIIRAGLSGGMS
jgi:hypothetical protein